MIDWAFGRMISLVVGGALDMTVGSGGTGRLFRNSGQTTRPCSSLRYFAQVLSAFKAVSADAFVG